MGYNSWWFWWVAFMFFFLITPVGYGWGMRGWGMPQGQAGSIRVTSRVR